jgi:hypothetical protein
MLCSLYILVIISQKASQTVSLLVDNQVEQYQCNLVWIINLKHSPFSLVKLGTTTSYICRGVLSLALKTCGTLLSSTCFGRCS